MDVPAVGAGKISGHQIALPGYNLFAYRTDTAVFGIVRPAIGASKDLHHLIAAFALEYLRLYHCARDKHLATDRAFPNSHPFFAYFSF